MYLRSGINVHHDCWVILKPVIRTNQDFIAFAMNFGSQFFPPPQFGQFFKLFLLHPTMTSHSHVNPPMWLDHVQQDLSRLLPLRMKCLTYLLGDNKGFCSFKVVEELACEGGGGDYQAYISCCYSISNLIGA